MLRTLARRVQAATLEAAGASTEILAHVRALAPGLLDEPGVGPIVAAQLIVSWSHTAGAAPKPPSPASPASPRSPPRAGKTTRYRLSRGGDRQLNRALHTVVLHPACTTPPPRTTSPDASPKAKPTATPPASSSATSPATSTAYSTGAAMT